MHERISFSIHRRHSEQGGHTERSFKKLFPRMFADRALMLYACFLCKKLQTTSTNGKW